MAFISSDGFNHIAVSIGKVLKLIEKSSGNVLLTYENQWSPTEDNPKDEISGFVCHAFSKDKEYLAALTEDKKLLVWTVKDKTLDCSYCLTKRPTCLDFCHHENTIVAADKYGDVYKCGYKSSKNTGPTLLLGHLSMVLSLEMSISDKYIITADRDEKIRISSYPNAYSIQSYCLGHTKLVSSLRLLSSDMLLSGSADSTLRLWDFKNGSEKLCIDVAEIVSAKCFIVSQIAYHNNIVCVIGEGVNKILFFEFINGEISFLSSKEIPGNPYNIVFVGNDEIAVSIKRSTSPFILLQKQGKEFLVKEDSFAKITLDMNTDNLPEPSYFTHHIKANSGKRSNTVITPEATINLESATKIVKTSHIDKIVEE